MNLPHLARPTLASGATPGTTTPIARQCRLAPLVLGALTALGVLGAASSSAFAQTYELRWPLKGLVTTAPTQSPDNGGGEGVEAPPDPVIPVSLTLAAGALPAAMVGHAYTFDFGSLLAIEGDNPPRALRHLLGTHRWPARRARAH